MRVLKDIYYSTEATGQKALDVYIPDGECKAVFVFGEARDKILSDVAGCDVPVESYVTMREAVTAAFTTAAAGNSLLLSPASTSFDEFSSFEERGDTFKSIIKDALGQENTGEKNEKVN